MPLRLAESHCETPFRQAHGPRPLIRISHTHTFQSFTQCSDRIFDVLFPKCSSCLVSPQDAVVTHWIVVFFSRILGSCGFLTPTGQLISFQASYNPPSHPVLSFDVFFKCLAESVPVWIYQEHHFSFAMWSKLVHDLQVPTSSVLSVNSSRLFLTSTSGCPSCPSDFVP